MLMKLIIPDSYFILKNTYNPYRLSPTNINFQKISKNPYYFTEIIDSIKSVLGFSISLFVIKHQIHLNSKFYFLKS